MPVLNDRYTINARLDAIEKALILLQDIASTHGALAQHDERINAIAEKFVLTDRIVQEHFASIDNKIITAFTVAERAVAKAELAAEKGYLEAQIEALRNAFTTQITTQKDALVYALAASDKAVLKAEVANEKRFESVNEFRSTLSDQQRDLATKTEVNFRFKALEDRINSVVEENRESRGRLIATRDVNVDNRGQIGLIVAIISVAIALGVAFLKS